MTRFLPRLLVLLALAAAGAHAQTTAPAKMGLTRGTVPEVLQVLDHGNTWVTIGNLDSTGHQFMVPVANGGTGTATPGLIAGQGIGITGQWPNQQVVNTSPGTLEPGVVYATDPAVGMAAGGQDNAPLVPALMAALGPYPPPLPVSAHGIGNAAFFPPVRGAALTPYYFGTGSLNWSRQSALNCGNSGQFQPTVLVFEAGLDGLVGETYTSSPYDGGTSATATFRGCEIASLGLGFGYGEPGDTQINKVAMPVYGAVPMQVGPTRWQAGDGIMVASIGQNGRTQLLQVAPGAYISAVSSDQKTLTLGSGYTLGGYPFGSVRASSVTGTLTGNVFNATAVSGGTIVQGAILFDYTRQVWIKIGTLGANGTTGTGGTGTYPVDPATPFNSQASATYVGVQTLTGVTIAGGSMTVTGVNGGTLSNTTYLTDVFPAGFGGTIPAGTVITGQTSGPAGGAGVYTINNSSISFSGTLYGGELMVGASNSYNGTSYANNTLEVERLPASLAYQVTTTAGSSTVTVTGGPSICLWGGDQIWSDAFLFGALVRTSTCVSSTAVAYPYTLTIAGVLYSPLMNATVSHPNGSGALWKIPSGFNRRVVSYSQDLSVTGFGFGLKMSCSSASGLNCTMARDRNNWLWGDFIGRLVEGNNTGGSGDFHGNYVQNYVSDIVELGTVNSTYTDSSTDSFEAGYTAVSVMGNCSAMPLYSGGYMSMSGGSQNLGPALNTGGYCMPTTTGGLVAPDGTATITGRPLFIEPEAQVPTDANVIVNGQFKGPWLFGGMNGWTKLTYSGGGITSGVSPGITAPYLFSGQSIADLTNPNAIPAGTTIASVNSSGAPSMSNAVQNPPGIQNKDVLQISAPGSAIPCVAVRGGLDSAYGIELSRSGTCTNGDWRLGFDGFRGAWDWYNPTQSIARPSFGFTQAGVYVGNNGFAASINYGVFANNGIMLGSGSSALFTDRLLSTAAAVPAVTVTNFTAAQAYLTTNSVLALTGGSVTGATSDYSFVDNTSSKILGTINATGTNTTTNWVTLTGNAAVASAAMTDTLLFAGGASTTAKDYFGTTQTMIPINGACTNVSGAVNDNSLAGSPSVGTVSACGTFATVTLRAPTGSASTGAADSLTATTQLRGNVALNQVAAAGGYAGWINTANGSGFRPFGPVANDAAGTDFTIPKTLRTGVSTNVDLTGRIALTSGTKTFTLLNAYASPPNCLCADVTTPANACSVSESTTTLTFTGTGSDTVKWQCIGLN